MPLNSVFKNIAFKGIFFAPVLAFSLLLVQCGQRGTPTGGIKDETAPQIKKSVPENNSTNFIGNKITLKFDEYVQVRSFNTEFLISPPVKSPPSYQLHGKSITLKFDSAFAENTTYTLFFGKAIVDLNESNPLDSNLFVFSTGPALDSLEFSGEIVDALTGLPATEIMVHLYKNLKDSAPKTEIPSYFSVAKKGRFTFKNLAAGSYKIFALQDANNNYLYDLPNEKIAFWNETIEVKPPAVKDSIVDSLTTTEAKIQLLTFIPEKTDQKILKGYSPSANQIVIPFNIPVLDYKITYLNDSLSTDSIVEYWNESKDSLTLYSRQFKNGNRYQLFVQTDTLTSDTFNIKIKSTTTAFKTSVNFKEYNTNNYTEPLVFSFNKPLRSFCDSCIFLIHENDTVKVTGNALNDQQTVLTLNQSFTSDLAYELVVAPSAFTAITGEQNDSLLYSFKTEKEGVYGQLLLNYNFSKNSSYIIELLSGGKTIRTAKSKQQKGVVNFKGLTAGSYQLKVIVDKNDNGKWTPGNYDLKEDSEQVILFQEPITIRANWDLELNWEIK